MSSITVKPLAEGLSFGTRVSGVTQQALPDEAVRKQLNELFQDRGLIVFRSRIIPSLPSRAPIRRTCRA